MHYLTKSCSQLLLLVSISTIHYVPGAAEGLEPDTYHIESCGLRNHTRKFGVTYRVQEAYVNCKLISLYEGLVVEASRNCTSFRCFSKGYIWFDLLNGYRTSRSQFDVSSLPLTIKIRNGTVFYVSSLSHLSLKVYDPRLQNISDPDYYIGYDSLTMTTSGYQPEEKSGVPAIIIGCIVALVTIAVIFIVTIKGYKIYSENCGGDVFPNSNDDTNEASGPSSAPPPEYTQLMLPNTAANTSNNFPSENKSLTVAPPPSYNEAIAMETV